MTQSTVQKIRQNVWGRGTATYAIIQTSHSDGIDQGSSCGGDVRGSDFEYILKIFFLPVID